MTKKQEPFLWSTSLQCTLSSREELPQFTRFLELLRDEGFSGIELNLPSLHIISPEELVTLLNRYHLQLDMLATGVYARHYGYSLSNPDPRCRAAAVEACVENLDYAARAGCGIILGFFKGGPDQDAGARERLVDSLACLSGHVSAKNVPVLLESTNHLESSAACTLKETLSILKEVGCPSMGLLADTYHIHLEEPAVCDALQACAGQFSRLHISDDNRAFPGLGSLDFSAIFRCLQEQGYQGQIAIEGNVQETLLDDTRRSAAYLRKACRVLGSQVQTAN